MWLPVLHLGLIIVSVSTQVVLYTIAYIFDSVIIVN